MRGSDRGGSTRLPALRLDAAGARHVDMSAMLVLAAPLILNSTLQSILTLTDTWFIGRLSTAATAGMAGIQWLIVLFLFLLNGTTMGVQTLVAQAHGGRRHRRASRALWLGLWASLFTILPFLLIAGSGHAILSPFGLPGDIEALAVQYWGPRMVGGPLAIALWTLNAYFNGLGHTRLPLVITGVVALSNVFLNEILMFRLGMGMAGSAWATTIAQGLGVALAFVLMLRLEPERFQPLRTWRLRWRPLWAQARIGMPMAASGVVDIGAAALFQLMQVRIGAVDGAATQIAMMFTSLAYMPGIGMALVGTTLVGQSIGAGDRDWAGRLGSRVIVTVALFMGGLGLVVALLGSWLAPLFVNPTDPHAAAVVELTLTLLWIAAAYQLFDGLNFASSFCLRGAGDARVPAIVVFVCAFGIFLPLTHFLTFAPGQGWITDAPGLGLGATGGWLAILVYSSTVGTSLLLRWRQGAWRRIRLL